MTAREGDGEKHRLKEVYDDKAETFAGSRGGPWSYVEEFCDGREGEVAVDLGCGAGRHLRLLRGFDKVLGVDFSRSMLTEARRTTLEDRENYGVDDGSEVYLIQADVERLPFSSDSCDLVLYIAALHHLPSQSRRLDSLTELDRVLSDDGVALLSVWAIKHPRFEDEREEILGADGDFHVSIGDRSRFYHIYERRELRNDLERSPLEVAKLELVDGNYYAVVSPG